MKTDSLETTFSSMNGAAHVVDPVLQSDLAELGSLGEPRGLDVGHVVQHEARHRHGPEVIEAAGPLHLAQVGPLRLEAPRDECAEAAGLVLQLSDADEVLDALLDGLHRPVHHGDAGPDAEAMGRPHEIQPGGRRILVRGDLLPHRFDQDLGPGPRNGIQTGGLQARKALPLAQLRDLGQIDDLDRREAVDVDREPGLDGAEQILEIVELERRVQSALDQDLRCRPGSISSRILPNIVSRGRTYPPSWPGSR